LNKAKFTMNALMVIVFIFSALLMLMTVGVYDLGEHAFLITDHQPIEGTDLSIRYSTKEISGIYKGPRYDDELVIEGNFGYDKGTAYCEGNLYLNEYNYSDADLVFCDAVCIDTESLEKKVIMKNAMIRGRCASGELVCAGDCLLQVNCPGTNSLCRLYGMASPNIDPLSDSVTVIFIDPAAEEIVYRTTDDDAYSEDFEERWLSRTLEEVQK